jgi:hypothetical protein
MRLERRTRRQVLRDKQGIATSMPDAMGGAAVRVMVIAGVAAVLTGAVAFVAVNAASADTSSGFQNANLAFEKAVHESDVVVGVNTDRIGLLKDVSGDKCEVQTWQGISRDGATALQVDTSTVDGVCTPTTPLLAAGSGNKSIEIVGNITTPAVAYENLGGRDITFDATAAPTLATGAKPTGVKQGDWQDVRPYKVSLTLQSENDKTAAAAKKAVSTGYTNVVNVTPAADDLRYVPSPSDDPVPGPVTITGVQRSTTVGDTFAGAREGVSVSFSGAVCPAAMPTKATISYTQQSPNSASPVTTVLNSVLTGASTTVELGQVPNGSSGAIEVAATCVDGGVVVKDSTAYVQPVPATVLTVTQNAVPEKHDLTWVAVSSLPTTFELRWSVGDIDDELLTTTSALAYQSVNKPGGNLGLTTTYTIVATVDTNKSPVATAQITNPLPTPPTTTVTSTDTGATWAAITCPAYSTAQYAARYYQQTGTDTTVSWGSLGAWSTSRTLTGVTTPAYGRTVTEVHTRCVADKSSAISPEAISATDKFYAPEMINVTAARSTTVGTVYAGAREGLQAIYSGARCYGGTSSKVDVTWQPVTPSGQSNVGTSNTAVLTGAATSVNLTGVANGAKGNLVGAVSCTAGKSSTVTKSVGYTQSVPAATVSVAQGPNAYTHAVSWSQVSSLPTTFAVGLISTKVPSVNQPVLGTTTSLVYWVQWQQGWTYGADANYSVTATVGSASSASTPVVFTTPWPTTPQGANMTYTRNGYNGNFVSGYVKWNYTGTCPAGTTLQGSQLENRTGQSNGTISNTVNYTGAWQNNITQVNWGPSYATQGYYYGMGLQTRCSSPNGLYSSVVQVQSLNWLTAFTTPPMSSWYAYRLSDGVRGATWTQNTCAGSGCPSLVVDYTTGCPAGTWVNWSNWTSQSWTGNYFNHPYGYQDNWGLPAGVNSSNVYYSNARYSCASPWTSSPQSPGTGTNVVTVIR